MLIIIMIIINFMRVYLEIGVVFWLFLVKSRIEWSLKNGDLYMVDWGFWEVSKDCGEVFYWFFWVKF